MSLAGVLYMIYMFQHDECYIQNNTVLTQVTEWSRLIHDSQKWINKSYIWLLNFYCKTHVKKNIIFSNISFAALCIQNSCVYKTFTWIFIPKKQNNITNQWNKAKVTYIAAREKIYLIFALLFYKNIEKPATLLKRKWKFARITIYANLQKHRWTAKNVLIKI